MRIHHLLPPLPPLPPREPVAPPPSRTGVALARLESLQLLWRDGQQRRRRPGQDSVAPPDAEEVAAPQPSPTGLNITA